MSTAIQPGMGLSPEKEDQYMLSKQLEQNIVDAEKTGDESRVEKYEQIQSQDETKLDDQEEAVSENRRFLEELTTMRLKLSAMTEKVGVSLSSASDWDGEQTTAGVLFILEIAGEAIAFAAG